jgi:hypothetical protein
MTKQEFINRVLLIMNEAGMSDKQGNAFIGADSAQVDRYIEGSYVDAWRRCVKVMPRSWFSNKTFANSQLVPDLPGGTGYVVLPTDFYLLTSFKMRGWQKAVHEAAVENERTAAIQSNEYTRGSEIRPVCIITVKSTPAGITHILKYYSLAKSSPEHVVEEAIYVPVVKSLKEVELQQSLDLSDQVIEPIAYLAASTVFTMFEKNEIAKALDQRAVEMFPGLQSMRQGVITEKQ